MNWKNIIESSNSKHTGNGIINVIECQGDINYANKIDGFLTVNIYCSVPRNKSDEFVEKVLLESLLKTGYDELVKFHWFDSKKQNMKNHINKFVENSDEKDKAVQIAKQRGVVSYPNQIFGTIELKVTVDVPLNWSNKEIKYTCIGQILKEGFDEISIKWQQV